MLVKAVVYQQVIGARYMLLFICRDLEVNEAKLRNYLEHGIYPAEITKDSGFIAGYIGSCGSQSAKCIAINMDQYGRWQSLLGRYICVRFALMMYR